MIDLLHCALGRRLVTQRGCTAVCVASSMALALAITSAQAQSAASESESRQTFTGDVPSYDEQAAAAGIKHTYTGPWEYFVGGGVASFDCNQDRLPDLYIAGGINPAALYVNESDTGGALQFSQRTSATTDLTGVTGTYPLDLDNDGYLDLVVLRVGENRLLKGGPDCQFKNVNANFNFAGGTAWSTAFAATFEPDSPFPTLAIGNYVDRHAPGSPWGTCHDNALYRPTINQPEGVAPNYADVAILSPGYCALSMLFTDWNKSGQDALRITNDRQYYRGGQEQLWRLNSGQYPRLYSRADGWAPLVIWGMGIAEADLNADGFPEYLLTSMGDSKLQTLDLLQATEENRPAYDDVAYDRGATAHRPYVGDDLKPSTGWHAQFEDVNNDALLDLYIAKGNVEAMSDFAGFDPDNLLLGQPDGNFSEQGERAGIALNRRGRGAAVVDLNADGLLDLVVVNRSAPVSLFRHLGASTPHGAVQSGNWLQIELVQKGSNINAIGARLAIKTGNKSQLRRIQSGGGHGSGKSGFVHIGLGVAERATLRVQWPDGQWSAPYRLFANNFVVVTRGDEHVSYWYPPAAKEIN